MAKITYPQQLPEDANSIKHVSIGQTRDGKDEFITPVTIWEVDKSTGEHMPAGEAVEVKAPRVRLDAEAQTALDGVKTELELVKAELELVKANQLSGDQKVQLPGSENFAKDLTIQEVTSELELVKAELQTIKTNQLSGDQKVQLYGTIVQLWGNDISERPDYSTITKPTAFTLLNSTLDTWVTDGTNDWVEV